MKITFDIYSIRLGKNDKSFIDPKDSPRAFRYVTSCDTIVEAERKIEELSREDHPIAMEFCIIMVYQK